MKWEPVKGFEGLYEVNEMGQVKSCDWMQTHSSNPNKKFLKKGKLISIRVGTAWNGYSNVMLTKDGKQKSLLHHRVVAEAFIPNPDNKPFINHKNGIKTDNRIENLEWVTRSENARHAFKIGLQSNKGENHPGSKVKNKDVLLMRNLYSQGYSMYAIWKDRYPCISYTTVKDIISKRIWSHA